MTKPKVAILAHAADRTGPPLYLLALLELLGTDDLDLVIVLLRGGELLSRFGAYGEVRVVGEPAFPVPGLVELREREAERVSARRAQLADLTDLDLVIVNTAWSTYARTWLPPSEAPVITIVHELQAGLGELLPPEVLDLALASDRFVVGCRPVERLLVERHGVAPDDVALVRYGASDAAPDEGEPADLAVAPGSFTVVAAAVPDRRKGPDLFVQIAQAAVRSRPDISWAFRWIGTDPYDPRLADARRDVDLYGIGDIVRFLPPTRALRATLSRADAFVLPSREDAFPLVVLEALLAGLPVACFDTGGARDVVEPDAGAVVAFPRVEELADVLAGWHDDPDRRQSAGRAGRARVLADHRFTDHARGVRAVIDEVLAGPGGAAKARAILDR